MRKVVLVRPEVWRVSLASGGCRTSSMLIPPVAGRWADGMTSMMQNATTCSVFSPHASLLHPICSEEQVKNGRKNNTAKVAFGNTWHGNALRSVALSVCVVGTVLQQDWRAFKTKAFPEHPDKISRVCRARTSRIVDKEPDAQGFDANLRCIVGSQAFALYRRRIGPGKGVEDGPVEHPGGQSGPDLCPNMVDRLYAAPYVVAVFR